MNRQAARELAEAPYQAFREVHQEADMARARFTGFTIGILEQLLNGDLKVENLEERLRTRTEEFRAEAVIRRATEAAS